MVRRGGIGGGRERCVCSNIVPLAATHIELWESLGIPSSMTFDSNHSYVFRLKSEIHIHNLELAIQ